LGLDKYPGYHHEPTDRDFRWSDRRLEWEKAELAKCLLAEYDTPHQRELIVKNAATGIFPIWWTVFSGDNDMKRRFRDGFPGTCSNCFDANENLLARPGGQL
jgi:hypothetical protein